MVAKLVVVVLEKRRGDAVVVGVNGIDGISGNCGKSGGHAWIACECTAMKPVVRGFDGFTRDGIRVRVNGCRVFVAVCRSRHVSFELCGLTQAEDDDSAILVDDAFHDECVKMRCPNRDRGLEFEDPAA